MEQQEEGSDVFEMDIGDESEEDLTLNESTLKEEPLEASDYVIEYLEEPEQITETKPKSKQNFRTKVISKKIENVNFYCNFCKKTLKTNKQQHIKMHKKEDPTYTGITCEKCKRKFFYENDLESHTCQPILKDCDFCDIAFDTSTDFRNHLRDVHFDEEGVFVCPVPDCETRETSTTTAFFHLKWHRYPGELKIEFIKKFDRINLILLF